VIEYDGRDEQTLSESIELARNFKAGGLDLLSVSVGFTIPDTNIPWGPAFMGPIAERVRREAGIPVTSAWGFGTPQLAEGALQAGHLDLVSVGRAHLADPHWAYFAAKELGWKILLDLAGALRPLAGALSLIGSISKVV